MHFNYRRTDVPLFAKFDINAKAAKLEVTFESINTYSVSTAFTLFIYRLINGMLIISYLTTYKNFISSFSIYFSSL